MLEIIPLVLRRRRRKMRKKRRLPQHFIPEVCAIRTQQSRWREILQVNPLWLKELISLQLLQLMRKGQRYSNRVLSAF